MYHYNEWSWGISSLVGYKISQQESCRLKTRQGKLGRDVNESSGCLWARLFRFAGAAGQQLGCDYAFCLFSLVSPQWKIALLLLVLYLVHFNLVWHHLKSKWENDSEPSVHSRLFKNRVSQMFSGRDLRPSLSLKHHSSTRLLLIITFSLLNSESLH